MQEFDTARERLGRLLHEGKLLEHDQGLTSTHDRRDRDGDVDLDMVQEGVNYFQANYFSMFVCMMTGLLSLMYINSITVILHLTGKSSSPSLAYQRYLMTMRHTSTWYKGPGVDSMIRSLRMVKVKHRAAAKQALRKGYLMSQYDMVLTQWAFIGPALLFPSSLGLPPPPSGLVYMMMLVGRYLGVAEELNLCSGGLARATLYSHLILTQVVQPALLPGRRSTEAEELENSLLKSVNMMVPFIEASAFKHWFLSLLSQHSSPSSCEHLSILSTLLLRAQTLLLETVLHLPVLGSIFRPVINILMRLAIFLNTDWEWLVIKFHEVVSWPPWFLILQAMVTIPVLYLGSVMTRVPGLPRKAFHLLRGCFQ